MLSCFESFVISMDQLCSGVISFDLYIGRTSKTPSTLDNLPVVLVSKGDHGSILVHGFADSYKCLPIFDGTTDTFASCMPVVKKKFNDTHAVRKFMQIDEVCKVFALVLENYTSKGPHTYETQVVTRARAGYGKCTLNYIKPTSNISVQSVSAFFKTASVNADMKSSTAKGSVTHFLNRTSTFCCVF